MSTKYEHLFFKFRNELAVMLAVFTRGFVNLQASLVETILTQLTGLVVETVGTEEKDVSIPTPVVCENTHKSNND